MAVFGLFTLVVLAYEGIRSLPNPQHPASTAVLAVAPVEGGTLAGTPAVVPPAVGALGAAVATTATPHASEGEPVQPNHSAAVPAAQPPGDGGNASTEAVSMQPQPRGDPGDPKVCHFELLLKTDFFGHDVGSEHAQTAEECCVLCQNFDRCGAFTFKGSQCWFKGSAAADEQLANDECVSAKVRETGSATKRKRTRRRRPPVPPPPPAPPYAIYLWLAPSLGALLGCILLNMQAGVPLFVQEGGAKCSTDDCCECE